MPNRISLEDSIRDILLKLSEGSPSAMIAILEYVKSLPEIDPDACPIDDRALAWIHVFRFDAIDLTGDLLGLLYYDICRGDVRKMIGLMRANQLGYLLTEDLMAAIRSVKTPAKQIHLDIDDLLEKVEDYLPNFKRKTQIIV